MIRKKIGITAVDIRRGMRSKIISLKKIKVDCSRQLRSYASGLYDRTRKMGKKSDVVPMHGLSKIFR